MFKARTEFSDFEYVKTLGLKIIAGRNFSSQFPTDTTGSALVNRTAAAKLGLTPKQAIGKWIKNPIRDKERRRIVGVVEDFNFLSLRENVEPLVIAPNEDRRVILVKTKAGSLASAMEQVRKQYAIDAPQYPYEYSFMDEKFDDLYKKDLKQQKLLSVFSGLAIFIACLGLFGLASFTTAKRIKEIGVRKVLGSSSQGIVLMLSKDLLRPVFLATLISIPLGYFIMQKWLESFAYRTPLHWWIFALAALITFVIALATVSSKALKAALTNPVKSLRSE
jgi:putative ABC transport system permease protein